MSETTTITTQSSTEQPRDRFGPFGGRYVPETLVPAIDALELAFDEAMADKAFRATLRRPPVDPE